MFDLISAITGLEAEANDARILRELSRSLLVQGHNSRQRRTLVIAGESGWCRRMAGFALEQDGLQKAIWISSVERSDAEVITADAAKALLGTECDAIVFDAHSGFDPDAFGAVCGTICAGGLMVLLCPPLSEWENFADPASERIAVSPFSYREISGRFIRRLIGIIRESDGVTIVEQDAPLPTLEVDRLAPLSNVPSGDFSKNFPDKQCRTNDQEVAVEAIEHVVHGHRRRPAVLISDRGRGKSAALGIAAARLLMGADSDPSRESMHIIVTAPQPRAVTAVFAHAQQLIPDATLSAACLTYKGSKIQFIAPDELCFAQVSADLVLVDEAAAIPSSMLTQLLKKYSRIAFASTVHGYEGTGRGFAVRFRQTLEEETPGWNEVRLKTPIRWAENDPLEQLVFRILLLDAESAEDEKVLDANVGNTTIKRLDRDALINDEQTLSQIFGLLVVAHYRTTPNDLRNLLDGPNVSVYVLCFSHEGKDQIVATALVSEEGAFSDELADAIFTGKRRPRGHLIPQSLVAHAGIKQAAQLRCARIMRIAVHPVLQRKALGSKLIQAIRHDAVKQDFHLIGVSFGATIGLMQFWKAQGMLPVRVGFRRDHASGEYSVMMLASLCEAGSKKKNDQGQKVLQAARSRLITDFPHWLSDSLRELDCDVAAELLTRSHAEKSIVVNEDDLLVLSAFTKGVRSYEDCSAALWRFSVAALGASECLIRLNERNVLIAKVLQKHTWTQVAALCGLTGRAEVIDVLRTAASSLLDEFEKST